MDLIFALAFVPDKILDLLPVPYLLEECPNANYKIHKRLTAHDLQHGFVSGNTWVGKIIELSGALAPGELNKKINKKHDKIAFGEFVKGADKNTINYLKEIVDRKKIAIVNIVKEHRALMFINDCQLQEVHRDDIIGISDSTAQVEFEFEKISETLHYRLKVFQNDKLLDLQKEKVYVITNNEPSIIHGNKLIPFDSQHFNGNKLRPFLKKGEITVNEKMQGVFLKKFIAPVVKKFEYSISGFEFIERETRVVQKLVIEKTFTNNIVATPVFWYRKNKVEFYKKQEVFVKVVEKNGIHSLESIHRDFGHEGALLNKLHDLGFHRKGKCFCLDGAPDNIYGFAEYFTQYIPKIREMGFEIINHLFKSEVNYSTPKINFRTIHKQDWFDLHIVIDIGEFKIKFKRLKHHILNGTREFILPDGSIFIIPETWFSEFYPFAKRIDDDNVFSLHATQLQLLKGNNLIKPDKTIFESLSKMEVDTALELPKGLTAKLRDYQKTGFRWLYQLTQNGFGACLADDMGLGKTLQVICVLQKYFENKGFDEPTQTARTDQLSLFDDIPAHGPTNGEPILPALLVVPKSLVFNWIEELRKFAPELTYIVYHGNDRHTKLDGNLHKVHIIITTYGMVRSDIDELKAHRFSYLIADESQAIKNPRSKIFKAMILLESISKISITGTPIENSHSDLWAQMSFLNDNILGNEGYFEEMYVREILKDSNSVEAEELKNITGPFILRRLKKDVAKELPPKIEQVIYCQMHEGQKEIYETEKSAIRNEILFTKNKNFNMINAFAVLNRLRQIAIHPLMIDGGHGMLSGKFDSIIHTIGNLIEQGHKFLVFSSFVKHLKLIQNHFENNGIPYSMLTGSSNKRKEIVGEYQNNADIKPFLISIKAGGMGLNITAASYVLIIDPWWNPFVELQAIDRAHRIGQTQKVVVYKFITKNSVEEKMMALQKSKLELSDTLINENNAGKIKLAEIEGLLS